MGKVIFLISQLQDHPLFNGPGSAFLDFAPLPTRIRVEAETGFGSLGFCRGVGSLGLLGGSVGLSKQLRRQVCYN